MRFESEESVKGRSEVLCCWAKTISTENSESSDFALRTMMAVATTLALVFLDPIDAVAIDGGSTTAPPTDSTQASSSMMELLKDSLTDSEDAKTEKTYTTRTSRDRTLRASSSASTGGDLNDRVVPEITLETPRRLINNVDEVFKATQKAFGWKKGIVLAAGKDENGTVIIEVAKNFRNLSPKKQGNLTEAALNEVKPLGYLAIQIIETESGITLTAGGLKVKFGEDARLLSAENRKLQRDIEAQKAAIAKEKAKEVTLEKSIAKVNALKEEKELEAERLLQIERSEVDQFAVDAEKLRSELREVESVQKVQKQAQEKMQEMQEYEMAQVVLQKEVKQAKTDLELAKKNQASIEQSLSSLKKDKADIESDGEKSLVKTTSQVNNVITDAINKVKTPREGTIKQQQAVRDKLEAQIRSIEEGGADEIASKKQQLDDKLEEERKQSDVKIAEAIKKRDAAKEKERQLQEDMKKQKAIATAAEEAEQQKREDGR